MKKILIVITIILLTFLSACNSAPTTNTSANSASTSSESVSAAVDNGGSSTASSILTTDYTDAASVEQQILAGALQLEGTENEITPDQASQLLTLLSSLSPFGGGRGNGGPQQPANGDTQATPQVPAGTPQAPAASSVDTDTIMAQIQTILTPAQLEAIAAMKLTNASIQTYISDKGLSLQPGNSGGQQGGNPPQGNPPSDGNNDSQPQGTPPADAGNGQPPDRSTNVLLNAVIQLLQQKTATSTSQTQ